MAFIMNIKTALATVLGTMLLAGCANPFAGDDDARDDYTAEQYYQDAKEHLDDGDWTEAIELYQELEGTYPFGSYTEQAQLEIVYAYYKNDNPEAALAAADRFIRLHPTHPNVDYAYYLKGLINFKVDRGFLDAMVKGRTTPDRDPRTSLQSYNAFQELVNRFPQSRYSTDARRKMTFLHNTLAMHEMHVADYYMRREAYVAVVNRGKYVLNQYPATPAVEHALGLMTMAYKEMGLEDLSADSQRVLALNFPDSRYLSGNRPPIKSEFSLLPDVDINPFN